MWIVPFIAPQGLVVFDVSIMICSGSDSFSRRYRSNDSLSSGMDLLSQSAQRCAIDLMTISPGTSSASFTGSLVVVVAGFVCYGVCVRAMTSRVAWTLLFSLENVTVSSPARAHCVICFICLSIRWKVCVERSFIPSSFSISSLERSLVLLARRVI